MTTQRRFTVVVVERDRLGPYARSQLLRDAGYRVIETSTNEDACSAAMRESAALLFLQRWYEGFAYPLGSPSERKVAIIFNDITERKNTEEELLLVDDHVMISQGLRAVLDAYTDVELVGEAGDGDEAVAAVDRLKPTVVIMDINMPKKAVVEQLYETIQKVTSAARPGSNEQSS